MTVRTVRWQALSCGRWMEQELLPCSLDVLFAARRAVGDAYAQHLVAHGETAALGLCHRTFAVVAAERAGAWPLPGAGKGFDEILYSYAIYLPIRVWGHDRRWRRVESAYGDRTATKLRARLARMRQPPERLWRATHYHNLRPTDARRSAGGWEWELQDPAGLAVLGSCYPAREVLAAPPERLALYFPPLAGLPEVVVESRPG
jgi:hypothetical protein